MGLQLGLNQAYSGSNAPKISDIIQQISLRDQELRVTYQWDTTITEVVRDTLISEEDHLRLKAYHAQLVELLEPIQQKKISMTRLLPPLFALAQERSKTRNPIEENRAVVLLLSTYINDRGLKRLAPESEHWPQPAPHSITLFGRTDFPQHFIVSAALSMTGGGILSNAIGVFKEVDDSRGGSGFSFTDLGADKAGTLFGQRLTSSHHAGILQSRLTHLVQEEDLMPIVSDLPEGLSEAEFVGQFGSIDSPQYKGIVAQIDQRLSNLTLYH